MPGDLLDLILIALIAAFAVAGYRQGFIIGILSLAGFMIGVARGALIAPGISRALAASLPWQAFIAILVVFAARRHRHAASRPGSAWRFGRG